MAREVVYTDDISGEHGAEPVRIGWNDVWFEVDLAEANRKKVTDFIETYINAGRPAQTTALGQVRRQRTPRGSGKSDAEKIDYTDPSYAGNPHKGRVSPAEAEYVKENLELVNRRLEAEGLRKIDPSDTKMAERYGL